MTNDRCTTGFLPTSNYRDALSATSGASGKKLHQHAEPNDYSKQRQDAILFYGNSSTELYPTTSMGPKMIDLQMVVTSLLINSFVTPHPQ